MKSPPEFCPKCQGSRDMILSLGLRKVAGSAHPEEQVLLVHFQCKSCLAYVKTIPMSDLEATQVQGQYRSLEKAWLQLAHAI